MAMLDIQGFFAIKTEGEDFNGEKIYLVRNKQAAKQIPDTNAVFYTLEELQILIAGSPPPSQRNTSAPLSAVFHRVLPASW